MDAKNTLYVYFGSHTPVEACWVYDRTTFSSKCKSVSAGENIFFIHFSAVSIQYHTDWYCMFFLETNGLFENTAVWEIANQISAGCTVRNNLRDTFTFLR